MFQESQDSYHWTVSTVGHCCLVPAAPVDASASDGLTAMNQKLVFWPVGTVLRSLRGLESGCMHAADATMQLYCEPSLGIQSLHKRCCIVLHAKV